MAPSKSKPSSPKLPSTKANRIWYRYYAGFSDHFVRDIVRNLNLQADQVIADPWNGSGTTTAVAEELGIRSWGGDINPAMIVIAKARLLGWRARPSETSLCKAILESATHISREPIPESEPLRAWFRPEASRSLRAVERAIAKLLDPASAKVPPRVAVAELSPLACFFYVALFLTVRQLLSRFMCSNPTWIRRATNESFKIIPSQDTVFHLFRSHVENMMTTDGHPSYARKSNEARQGDFSFAPLPSEAECLATLAIAPSTNVPLSTNSVAAIISSPPYRSEE